jgi:hypothetical protein
MLANRLLEAEVDTEAERYLRTLVASKKKETTCCKVGYQVSKSSRNGTRVICNKCGQPTRLQSSFAESDEDFDPQSELDRYTRSDYPGFEIEMEGNHWNVYKLVQGIQWFIGEVTYDDMANMPVETMTPEQIAHWDAHHWFAVAGFRDNEREFCQTFDAAVKWVIAVNRAKTAPLRESEDVDDPQSNLERFASQRSAPITTEFTTVNGRRFRVKLKWDTVAGGTSYGLDGKPVPHKPQPGVDFYDMTVDPSGQFVSGYFASTLVEREPGTGLDLYGGVPEWTIDWRTMDLLIPWIKREVESRGFRLTYDEAGGISFGAKYESIEPDDPELYLHPEKYTAQPSWEKLESSLRVMLRPYYDEISINRRPAHLAHLFKGMKDYWTWTIHCKRNAALRLPKHTNKVDYFNPPVPVDWRRQVEKWFWTWAKENHLGFYKFTFYGRLRKDPTFQFDTDAGFVKKLKEGEVEGEDLTPEAVMKELMGKVDWDKDLHTALWEFHPFGVGYQVLAAPNVAFVLVSCYFPPDKDNYLGRLKEFVVNWLMERRILVVKSAKAYQFKHVGAAPGETKHYENYPRWTAGISINSDWPPNVPEHVPATVEVG